MLYLLLLRNFRIRIPFVFLVFNNLFSIFFASLALAMFSRLFLYITSETSLLLYLIISLAVYFYLIFIDNFILLEYSWTLSPLFFLINVFRILPIYLKEWNYKLLEFYLNINNQRYLISLLPHNSLLLSDRPRNIGHSSI